MATKVRGIPWALGTCMAGLIAGGIAVSPAGAQAVEACAATKASPPQNTIIAILERHDLAKSDYETSQAYEDRLSKMMGGISEVTFVTPVPAQTGKYDADTETFTLEKSELSGYFSEMFLLDGKSGTETYLGEDLATTRVPLRSFVGENAFGVKRNITVTQVTIYGVVFRQQGDTGDTSDVVFSVPRAKAKEMRAGLKFVVSGKLASPFTVADADYATATVQSPHEAEVRRRAFVIEPQCAAIVDGATGHVLAKFDPTLLQ